MAYSEILFEKQNAIATITINRPHAMNAGTIRTWGEIADAFQMPSATTTSAWWS